MNTGMINSNAAIPAEITVDRMLTFLNSLIIPILPIKKCHSGIQRKFALQPETIVEGNGTAPQGGEFFAIVNQVLNITRALSHPCNILLNPAESGCRGMIHELSV